MGQIQINIGDPSRAKVLDSYIKEVLKGEGEDCSVRVAASQTEGRYWELSISGPGIGDHSRKLDGLGGEHQPERICELLRELLAAAKRRR